MDADLKSKLEAAYKKVRAVIVAKGTQAQFDQVFEENENLPPLPPDQWPMMLAVANLGYPDPSKLHFVSIAQKGDYAYYYAWTDGNKPDRISFWAYVFHNAKGVWKLTGYSQSINTKRAAGSDQENDKLAQNLIPDLDKQVSAAMN